MDFATCSRILYSFVLERLHFHIFHSINSRLSVLPLTLLEVFRKKNRKVEAQRPCSLKNSKQSTNTFKKIIY